MSRVNFRDFATQKQSIQVVFTDNEIWVGKLDFYDEQAGYLTLDVGDGAPWVIYLHAVRAIKPLTSDE
jgi:hypothetical protein